MYSIIQVTTPFFALILCGFIAMRRGWLQSSAIPGLNGYVLFFALPCMLFQFGAQTSLAQIFQFELFSIYLLSALLIVATSMCLDKRAGLGRRESAFAALVASFPNTGYMGVPLLLALLGQYAASPVIMTIVIDMFITTSLCIALAESQGSGHWQEGLRRALIGVLKNPLPWAIAMGSAVSMLQIHLPKALLHTIELLGQSASPVALFAIGAVLARTWAAAKQPHPATTGFARGPWPIVFIKLFLHPLVVLVVCWLMAYFQNQTMQSYVVLVLVAALPSASNVQMLAERYQAQTGRMALVIFYSTALAFFTFPVITWLYQLAY